MLPICVRISYRSAVRCSKISPLTRIGGATTPTTKDCLRHPIKCSSLSGWPSVVLSSSNDEAGSSSGFLGYRLRSSRSARAISYILVELATVVSASCILQAFNHAAAVLASFGATSGSKPSHSASTQATKEAPNSALMSPCPRSSRGRSSFFACFSRAVAIRASLEGFKVLSKAVRKGVCAGASKFRGGLRRPLGSLGTTALTEEMYVEESRAARFDVFVACQQPVATILVRPDHGMIWSEIAVLGIDIARIIACHST